MGGGILSKRPNEGAKRSERAKLKSEAVSGVKRLKKAQHGAKRESFFVAKAVALAEKKLDKQ